MEYTLISDPWERFLFTERNSVWRSYVLEVEVSAVQDGVTKLKESSEELRTSLEQLKADLANLKTELSEWHSSQEVGEISSFGDKMPTEFRSEIGVLKSSENLNVSLSDTDPEGTPRPEQKPEVVTEEPEVDTFVDTSGTLSGFHSEINQVLIDNGNNQKWEEMDTNAGGTCVHGGNVVSADCSGAIPNYNLTGVLANDEGLQNDKEKLNFRAETPVVTDYQEVEVEILGMTSRSANGLLTENDGISADCTTDQVLEVTENDSGSRKESMWNAFSSVEKLSSLAEVIEETCKVNCDCECVHVSETQQSAYLDFRKLVTSGDLEGAFPSRFLPAEIDENAVLELPDQIRKAFVPLKVPADGSCLYHSVSRVLFGIAEGAKFLRRLQLSELISNEPIYRNLCDIRKCPEELEKVRKQSASLVQWGFGFSILIFSSLLQRDFYVYSNEHNNWTKYCMESSNTKKFSPIFLYYQNGNHFMPLLVVEKSVYSDFPKGHHYWLSPMSEHLPRTGNRDKLEKTQYLGSQEGCCKHEETPNLTSEENAASKCENQQQSVNPSYGHWNPDILHDLHLHRYISNNKALQQDRVLFVNSLRDEMFEASQGPWEANIPIFSKRSTHQVLWWKKIDAFNHKYPADYKRRKAKSMRVFLMQKTNYSFIQDAMIALGVPADVAWNYSYESWKNSVSADNIYSEAKGVNHKRVKTTIPDYVKEPKNANKEHSDSLPPNDFSAVFDANLKQREENDQNEPQVCSKSPQEKAEPTSSKPEELTEFEKEVREIAKSLGVPDEVFSYQPPMQFQFAIPPGEMEAMFDDTTGLFVSTAYPATIDKYLNQVQRCCSFKRATHSPHLHKTDPGFATIHGRCGCGMTFTISILAKPSAGSWLQCSVKSNGVFKLIQENPVGRQIRGKARQALKEKMLHVKASREHLERLLACNPYKFLHNNLPQMSSAVLRTIRAEAKSMESEAKDPFDDINIFACERIKSDEDKTIKGFVQNWGRLPDRAHVLMYTEESLNLVTKLQSREELVLHLDATGTVVTQKGITQKKVLLYLALVRSKNYCFPVAEALSQIGIALDIADILTRITEDSKRLSPTCKPIFGVAVCDYSYAMIHGIVRGLNSMTLADYLLESFQVLAGARPFSERKTVVFICTAHLIHAFSSLMKRHVPKPLRFTATHALARLQEAENLEIYTFVIRQICTLFEAEYLDTEEVNLLQASLRRHSYDLNDEELSETFDDIILECESHEFSTLRSASPVYKLFVRERQRTLERNQAVKSSSTNPFYCVAVVQLIQDYYSHMTPLFSAMILNKTGRCAEARITNAPVEGEFNFMKHCFNDTGKTSINLYVRMTEKYHKGKLCKVMESLLLSNKNLRRRPRSQTKPSTQPPKRQLDRRSKKNRTITAESNKSNSNNTLNENSEEQFLKRPKPSKVPTYFSTEKKLSNNRNIGEAKGAGQEEINPTGTGSSTDFLQDTLPKGLHNVGQICFLNSLVQALMTTVHGNVDVLSSGLKLFYEAVYSYKSSASEAHVRQLISNLELELGEDIPVDVQQCVHEYFVKILSSEQSTLRKEFTSTQMETLTCECGNSRSMQTEKVDLVIDEAMTKMGESLVFKTGKESVNVKCGSCSSERMTRTEGFQDTSRLLCLRELIFRTDGSGRKVGKEFLKNQVLEKVTIPTPNGSVDYGIVSAIAHIGGSINSGHYVAYLKKDNYWIKCDDTEISVQKNKPRFVGEEVYLSFYQKIQV